MQEREIEWLVREKYKGRNTNATKRDIERLQQGEHIDYVIGFSNFLKCKIDLSSRPLIPRPETEYWGEKAIKDMLSRKERSLNVLDIFSGSGCIGIATLKHVRKAQVDFADIEPKYFQGIKKSLKMNRLNEKRAHFFASDVLLKIPLNKYDYILANPPYIPTSGRKVASSVLKQEPHTALFGGRDGLTLIRKLLKNSKKYLAPQGKIYLEFDPPQKTKIDALARRSNYRSQFFKDQYGRFRYVVLEG